MTNTTWQGGTGRMNNGANWSTGTRPVAGDNATISSGNVQVYDEGTGVNVRLAGINGGNPTLELNNSAIGSITLGGLAQFEQTGTLAVAGQSSTAGIIEGGTRLPAGHLTINLAPNATLVAASVPVTASVAGPDTSVYLNRSTLVENGGAQSVFRNEGTMVVGGASSLFIGSSFAGPGTIQDTATSVDQGGQIEFGGAVSSDAKIVLSGAADAAASLKIDDARDFKGNVTFNDGLIDLGGSLPDVQTWSLSNGVLHLGAQGGDAVSFNFVDQSPTAGKTTNLEVAKLGNDYYVTEGTLHQPAGAVPLHSGSGNPPPPAAQHVAAHDNTTGADVPDTSTLYTGPVAGIGSQFVSITPDNLNISAMADGMFIKTGAGNDAVALRGGTNVVDAGGGSNFLTSGSGFDTFFLDARDIPAASSAAGPVPGAIWDTIQGFGHGDAATIFGIGPGSALDWQYNEGAVGHTGLTLHANLPNGSEASLTLTGIDSRSGLQLSYGQTGGANYLYVKAA